MVCSTLLVLALLAGVAAVPGTAAANAPTESDCTALSWSTQTVSGEPYYEVDSVDKLQCIETKGLGDNYVQTTDIDASETARWNGASGFDPIGDKTNEFTGTFDGNGYAITGLTIDRGGTYSVGLFSEVGPGGTITAVGLEGGSVTGARRTGQLAGYNDGTVEDSHATGEVAGTERVGGLVGRNDGTVRRSYAIGGPTRGSDWFGGLVGFNQGAVTRSFAARAVDGGGGSTSAGGLVGVSTGTIADSYATGTVTASWYAGGVLGSFQADPGGIVRRSYAIGALSVDDESQGIGGLVGGSAVEPTTVEQAYWDVGTTNEESVSTGDGWDPITVTDVSGFGATADTAPAPEMQGASAETNMPGLDFTGTWETVENSDSDATADGYPILRSLDRREQLRAQGIEAPLVESITRDSPTSEETNAASVDFHVAFSEPVESVSADDFTTSGTASGTVEAVSSESGSTITVTVGSVSGDGSLGLALASGGDVTDADGDALSTTEPEIDERYAIDTTAPSVSAVGISDDTDGDGAVAAGDTVRVTATVTDANAVSTVTADASAFDAGTVTLSDDGPNSTTADDEYSATFAVGAAATREDRSVTVSATDALGNGGSQAVASNALRSARPVGGSSDSDPKPSAAISIVDVTVSAMSVTEGDPVELTATLENAGDAPGQRTVALSVDGEDVATERVTLDPGENRTVTLSHRFGQAGTYRVWVGPYWNAIDVAPADSSGATSTTSSGEAIDGDRESSAETQTREPTDVETTHRSSQTGSGPTNGAGPGFGVTATLAALCSLALLSRRSEP
ncbi:hypothetical protein OB920_05385 [Halobacteria archaeon HArc-gm2]|nr:hypothetical protein [Halobacteria archaeon HArc-gm2]